MITTCLTFFAGISPGPLRVKSAHGPWCMKSRLLISSWQSRSRKPSYSARYMVCMDPFYARGCDRGGRTHAHREAGRGLEGLEAGRLGRLRAEGARRPRGDRAQVGRGRRPRLRDPGRRAGIEHRSEEHTSELQSHSDLVCRLLLEKKKRKK